MTLIVGTLFYRVGSGNIKSRSGKWQEERRKQQVQTRLLVYLFRHKEMLKKDILKKRALLEKEMQIDIQVGFLIINLFKNNKYYVILCSQLII